MRDIQEYIKLSKKERQKHLVLKESCIERGGSSDNFKGLLAHFLGTMIPDNKAGHKIHLCHGCHNAKCSNPKHLYWGTPGENCGDAIEKGTHKTIWERMVDKYGYEKACEINSHAGRKGGLSLSGIPKTEEHKQKLSESLKKRPHVPRK